MDITTLVFGILLGFLIGFFLVKAISVREHASVRKTAIRGSRNSIMGEVYEKVLPALPSFPYSPKDMVFVGK